MSLKVPEVEKFYKLPDSRAVVEFRINTSFTASCFFGTLLVAFAQIKDSYILVRCSATIVSTIVSFSKGNSFTSVPFTGTGKLKIIFLIQLPSGCLSGNNSIRSINARINSFRSTSEAAS